MDFREPRGSGRPILRALSGALVGLAVVAIGSFAALADPQVRRSPSTATGTARDPASHVRPPQQTFDGSAEVAQTFTLSTPTRLVSTTDPQVCSKHGGFVIGLACQATLAQGHLVLVWDFAANRATVTGFHIYRVTDPSANSVVHVGDQANGADVSAFVVETPPAGGYNGACYEVSAFGGGRSPAGASPTAWAPAKSCRPSR